MSYPLHVNERNNCFTLTFDSGLTIVSLRVVDPSVLMVMRGYADEQNQNLDLER